MGIKTRIEQSIERAKREGRPEDAVEFEQDLVALRAQRSQAAVEGERNYTVQPGDNYFSIAQEQLGDERSAKILVQANPTLTHLRAGMVIVIPRARREAREGNEQNHAEKPTVATRTEEAEPGQQEAAAGVMSPEEEDALVDDLVVLFRALEQEKISEVQERDSQNVAL